MTDRPRYFRLRLDRDDNVYEEEIDPTRYITTPTGGLPVSDTPETRYDEAYRNEIAIAEAEHWGRLFDSIRITRGGLTYPASTTPES